MTHYEDMYNKLLVAHEAHIKQYNRLQEKYDDVMILTKRYSDHMEFCLQELLEENQKLKEKIKKLKELTRTYENGTN